MHALETYDISRGVEFDSYSAPHIREAMLDELLSTDWLWSLVRSRAKKLKEATKAFEGKHGYVGSDQEIAQSIGISEEEFAKLKRDANAETLLH